LAQATLDQTRTPQTMKSTMRVSFRSVLLLVLFPLLSNGNKLNLVENPIRKVVTLLQRMKEKVTAEGVQNADDYAKFACYCKTNGGDLTTSIQEAKNQIESLTSSIKRDTEQSSQTTEDRKQHVGSRDEAKDAMFKSTALRKKEAGAYAVVKSDSDTNLAALGKAISAMERGVSGGFLQTSAAMVVKKFAIDSGSLADETRQELLAFLSGGHGQGYVPQSGEIMGILKQLQDEMSQSLADATSEENTAFANYKALIMAKDKEVRTLQQQIEEEMTREGNLEVAIAGMSNDLEDTIASLTADEKFQMGLSKSCATKKKQWEETQKTRTAELLALAETIKVLNDDDALELFKKVLPSASMSFLQVEVREANLRRRALSLISSEKSSLSVNRPELDLLSLALRGKKAGFTRIISMIDEMVANLHTEQEEDDGKKQYCESQFDESEDKKKLLEHAVSDSGALISQMQGAIEQLSSEIAGLEAGVKALDKSVAEGTAIRKQENEDFKELTSSDSTAKEVLRWAQNRLNKFYDPKLFKPAPEREMTEEERITVNMGGTLAPIQAGGIAGTGIGASLVEVSSHIQQEGAPPPPPETFGAYSKKTGMSRGVISMIDLLVADLDKEMNDASVNEKNSQAEYEDMMASSAAKRAADSRSITEKTSEKASTQEALQQEEDSKADVGRDLMSKNKYIHNLHGECDWLLTYYGARVQARAGEIESLESAKAVLSGADYSFL